MNRLLLYLHRKSREQKHRLFLQMLRPAAEMRILNIGASGTGIGLPEQLESFYEHRSQIIGGGISFADVQDYRNSFPGVQAVVFDGCALPFADKSFRYRLFQCCPGTPSRIWVGRALRSGSAAGG